MKNVNKILVLILVAISWTVEAQIQELTRQAQIIIEGEVISTKAKWNEDHTLIFTDNQF